MKDTDGGRNRLFFFFFLAKIQDHTNNPYFPNFTLFFRAGLVACPGGRQCDRTRVGVTSLLHGLLATYPELGAAPNGHDGDSGYNESDLCARAHQVCRGTHRESNHEGANDSTVIVTVYSDANYVSDDDNNGNDGCDYKSFHKVAKCDDQNGVTFNGTTIYNIAYGAHQLDSHDDDAVSTYLKSGLLDWCGNYLFDVQSV